ncbi:hypothetical protein [Paenibacillus tyrfis]|uniref:hypothetical protein n=1 Tax=Paenibacillus tyrfis TaxID=1501230 RepID=UPI00209E8746|nr:hypothetical protein [Paenibacillus tyrfis]MCP1308185.1 hypothetical protein [Paenibacillus tyrfis]
MENAMVDVVPPSLIVCPCKVEAWFANRNTFVPDKWSSFPFVPEIITTQPGTVDILLK